MKIVVFLVLALFVTTTAAEVTRASRFVDRVVLTSDGELLGRVEDFALESDTLDVAYVVVSVGSYLIDNNLIAVRPDVLSESDTGEYLVIDTEALVDAPRFDSDSWPEEAQISLPVVTAPTEEEGGLRKPGVAEIVASDRRVTIDASGEQSVTEFKQPAVNDIAIQGKNFSQGMIDSDRSDPAFRKFDINGDGYLSRREIAPYFKPGLRFSDYDSDGNGGLDPFELEVLQQSE